MIVFGHNNFLIKRVKPSELGMPDGDASGMTFEVRQHYAHIFWIPFFPIGKIYGIRKAGDSSMYQMPDSVKKLINKRKVAKTPWYTFAGPLLLGAAFMFYNISQVLDHQKSKGRFNEKVAERKGFVNYPTTGDYYHFKISDKENNTYDAKDVYLKVNKYTDDKIEFISLFPDLTQTSEQHILNLHSSINTFDTVARHAYNRMSIRKAPMLNAIRTRNDLQGMMEEKPVYIDELKSYCTIEEIERRELE